MLSVNTDYCKAVLFKLMTENINDVTSWLLTSLPYSVIKKASEKGT